MGYAYQHSTPAPQEDDWMHEHVPPSDPLSTASSLAPKPKGDTYEFDTTKNSWNEETLIHELGLQSRPIENECCMLLHKDAPLVVMKEDAGKKIQIYSLTPATRNQASCGTYQDQPLYKWGVVKKRRESNQYDMTTTVDGAKYASEYFGSILFDKRKVVLKRNGLVCASMVRDEDDTYKCRVGSGIDPVLIVSFVACMDKIHQGEVVKVEFQPKVSQPSTARLFLH